LKETNKKWEERFDEKDKQCKEKDKEYSDLIKSIHMFRG